MPKPTFNERKYPNVQTCEALDRQISSLRDEYDKVQRKEMYGNANTVRLLKYEKELRFASLDCQDRLVAKNIGEGQDFVKDELQDIEEKIVKDANRKRLVMLVGGSAVLLIGLSVLLFVKYGKK